ncbi:hypothetical protein MAUB_65470 (plasmid) [Mycolicibacterium aubagnense]|uniref:Tyr recombinase domain-containing protein n=1 Tax=Mycolicibacterium aubagnense TaxID=319707 RepID=A0ABN5Z5S8_9MYCO|nr:hypothetical protein MAUB_65470 [Mycolicibacterium aubagnense]
MWRVPGPGLFAAPKSGRYAQLGDAIVVGVAKRPGTVNCPTVTVDSSTALGTRPVQRCAAGYFATQAGLEPLWLWLNENGLPRDAHGWHHTFAAANDRIATLGVENFTCTPHMLRHSFALRWFSIGKLVYSSRLGHLSEEEARDFESNSVIPGTWCRRCWGTGMSKLPGTST